MIQSIDTYLITAVETHLRNPVCDKIMTALTHLGDMGIIWILICVVMLFFKKYRLIGLMGLISLAAGSAVNSLLLKTLIARPRPYITIQALTILIPPEGSWSMPSGHAASAFSTAGIFAFYLHRKAAPYIILAALIAFSRLYVGVHYPSDIICGALVGILISALIYYVSRRARPLNR